MAIYHLNARTGTRGNGQSARAKNEYIEREGRYAGRDGQKKADVQVVLSGNMPEWALNHRDYWKAADQYERSNGRLYKEIEFALPTELNPEEMQKVAHDFAEYITGNERLPYTFAIHINDPENPHCHLMISERANDGIARSPDVWFSRADSKQPERGGAKKTTSLMPKEWLVDTRAAWEKIANESLERAGSVERIDHRTLAAQGIGREPTAHRGVHGEVKRHHREIQRLEAELSEAKIELTELMEQEVEAEKEHFRASILSDWADHFVPDVELQAVGEEEEEPWKVNESAALKEAEMDRRATDERAHHVAALRRAAVEGTTAAIEAPQSQQHDSNHLQAEERPALEEVRGIIDIAEGRKAARAVYEAWKKAKAEESERQRKQEQERKKLEHERQEHAAKQREKRDRGYSR